MNQDLTTKSMREDPAILDQREVAGSVSRVRLLAQIPRIESLALAPPSSPLESAAWQRIDAPHGTSRESGELPSRDELAPYDPGIDYAAIGYPVEGEEDATDEWKFDSVDPTLLEREFPLAPAATLSLVDEESSSLGAAPTPRTASEGRREPERHGSERQGTERPWRVDAPSHRSKHARSTTTRGHAPARGHVADQLFELHSAVAPHAGFIVTLALVFSAGLLYWLTIGPTRARQKMDQATTASDLWQSEASSSDPLSALSPDQRMAISTYPYGGSGRSQLNGFALDHSFTTDTTPENSKDELVLEGPALRIESSRVETSRVESASAEASSAHPQNAQFDPGAKSATQGERGEDPQTSSTSASSAEFAGASPYPSTSFPAMSYPQRPHVASETSTPQTTRK